MFSKLNANKAWNAIPSSVKWGGAIGTAVVGGLGIATMGRYSTMTPQEYYKKLRSQGFSHAEATELVRIAS